MTALRLPSRHLPQGRILAILLAATAACAAWPAARAAGTCPPAQIGQPCPAPGAASMAPDEPALNLGAGNPVHIVTGNKTRRDTDMPALPQAPGLEIVRHYNALDPRSGPLGGGWALSYETRLYWRGGAAQVVQADGSRFAFGPEDGAGSCAAQQPAAGRLQRDGPGWHWLWPDGRRLDFDAAGRLIGIVHPSGIAVRIERDARPGPTQGEILSVADGSGMTLRMHYETDAQGARLARIDTPLGRYGYSHEPAGDGWRLTAARRPDGMLRRYFHDAALQGGAPAHALTGVALQDADGRTLPLGGWAYDAQGRVAVAGSPAAAAGRMRLHYQPPQPGRDGVTRVETAAGTTLLHTAQVAGRYLLRSVEGPGCPGCAEPGSRADYDDQGRLARINGLAIERDAQGGIAALAREDGGWPGLRLRYGAVARTGPASGSTLVAWSARAGGERRVLDAAGRTRLRLHEGGDRWRYRHDARGRPTQVRAETRRAQAPALTLGFAWDAAGRLAAAAHPHESEYRRYDAQGLLQGLRVMRPATGDGSAALAYEESYRRDAQGRILRHRLPEGGTLDYAWDGPLLARIAWTDAAGRTRVLLRRPRGGGPGYEHGNGLRTLGWLRAGRLAGLAVGRPEGGLVFAQALAYDPQGRIAQENVHITPESMLGKKNGEGRFGGTTAYAYDAQSRLAMAVHRRPGGPKGTQAVDASKGEGGTASTHGESDRSADGSDDPSRSRGTDRAGADAATARRFYAWRGDGSALHAAAPRRDASGLPASLAGRSLHYDALRRLQAVRAGPRLLQSQRHNAHGQRIFRRDAGGDTHYLYVDGRLAAEARTAAGRTGIVRRYVHAGWTPVAMIDYARPQPVGVPGPSGAARAACPHAAGQAPGPACPAQASATHPPTRLAAGAPVARVYAIHADAVGAPRAVTDEAGRVRWRADLDALGRARRVAGDLRLDLRLPGQVHDPATGWHHNGLRTYDPAAGHYLEADPLGPLPGSQAYGYAAQQPRRLADPLGLLLYAFDGTRNDPSSLTNVWLLSQAYADGPVRYQPGPGRPGRVDWDAIAAESAARILAVQWERLLADLSAARLAAGPVAIDLLGYSRGAALARHFGNLIAERLRRGRFWLRDPGLGVVTACVDLRFMGLFDTVAQFGVLGSGDAAYDLTVADAWQWVAHAVALHERRWLFPLSSLDGSPGGNAVEAPFVGAHADIGGGYLPEAGAPADEQGDLSDVALNWMHWQARAAGVPVEDLPPPQRRVDRPLLHDPRPAGLRRDDLPGGLPSDSDRRVDDAAGDRLVARQDSHPRYGAQARREAEAFIDRLPGWMNAQGTVVGRVDMQAYRRWLERELGYAGAP